MQQPDVHSESAVQPAAQMPPPAVMQVKPRQQTADPAQVAPALEHVPTGDSGDGTKPPLCGKHPVAKVKLLATGEVLT
jgi:hypothetical protein